MPATFVELSRKLKEIGCIFRRYQIYMVIKVGLSTLNIRILQYLVTVDTFDGIFAKKKD